MNIDLGLVLNNPISALLLGPLVTKVVDKAKRQFGTLDASPAYVKQAAAFAVGGLAALTGHALQVSPDSVGALVQGLDSQTLANAALIGLAAITSKHSAQVTSAEPSSSGASEVK